MAVATGQDFREFTTEMDPLVYSVRVAVARRGYDLLVKKLAQQIRNQIGELLG